MVWKGHKRMNNIIKASEGKTEAFKNAIMTAIGIYSYVLTPKEMADALMGISIVIERTDKEIEKNLSKEKDGK